MTPETDAKLDSILISCVNRLYTKEEKFGLEYEDLRCLEIISKIAKEAKADAPTNTSAITPSAVTPANLIDMLRAVRIHSGESDS